MLIIKRRIGLRVEVIFILFFIVEQILITLMKLGKKVNTEQKMKESQENQVLFPYCCLEREMPVKQQEKNPKSQQKFIKLTLSKLRVSKKKVQSQQQHQKQMQQSLNIGEMGDFEMHKSDFLDQIRKFRLNPQGQREDLDNKSRKTLQYSKDTGSSGLLGQNRLSSLLESISNEMFSEMLISSSIKGKINLSGSLGSISQVRSQMQNSYPTQSLVQGLHFTNQY